MKVVLRKYVHFKRENGPGYKAYAYRELDVPFRPIKGDSLRIRHSNSEFHSNFIFFDVDKITWVDDGEQYFLLENSKYNTLNGEEGSTVTEVHLFPRYRTITLEEILEETEMIQDNGWRIEIFSNNCPKELQHLYVGSDE